MNGTNLRDYISLFELEGEIDSYREQLYAEGRNLLLKFNHLIDIVRENTNLSLTQLANIFEISTKQFRKWRNGESPIPLRVLKIICQLCNVNQHNIEEEIDFISSSRGIGINIPTKITPLLIEVLGRFSGDGSCGIYDGEYKWSIKEEGKRLVRTNLRDMETLFGIRGEYIDNGSYAENLIRSKPLTLLFQRIFNYHPFFEKTYDIRPPHFLNDICWEHRKYFTTGLIDTEGSFYYYNQSYYFEIHMVNSYLLDEVAKAFDEYGIPFNYKTRNNGNFQILSYGRININLINELFEIKNDKHLRKLATWDF